MAMTLESSTGKGTTVSIDGRTSSSTFSESPMKQPEQNPPFSSGPDIKWIPAPSEIEYLDTMSQRASKRRRLHSGPTDYGPVQSPSLDNERSTTREAFVYASTHYPDYLELKRCYMRASPSGPLPEDVGFCKRLLRQPIEIPDDTLFDDKYFQNFRVALTGQSESRLLVDLHPLLMPSAESQFLRGRTSLKNVIDGYNDSWLKTEPIYGPKPQPDHARGLKLSTFSESQLRKLGIKPKVISPYAVRENMCFPYLTAELKSDRGFLMHADRQNMHSMCVALRAVVTLAQAAGCPEAVHRRILGFSISHDLESIWIYGHYPEIEDDKASYYWWPISSHGIWTEKARWACYQFVQNVDREFLPVHTDRLMQLLAELPDPEENPLDVVVGGDSDPHIPMTASDLATPLQDQRLPPEIRDLLKTMEQQIELLEEQHRLREESKEAERKKQKEQEERLLAEQKEFFLAQLEQQRLREEKRDAGHKELQEKLFALLESKS